MKKIYLDYAASTPIAKEVLKEMMPYFSEIYGNPSSLHYQGRESRDAIEKSRAIIANKLNCKSSEIIFTGSATGGNNIAILGLLKNFENPHVLISRIEHSAVIEPIEENGYDFDYIDVREDGIIDLEDLKRKIKPNTKLVSVMYANNEIGTIEPIEEIGKILKDRDIYFHTDAVQALNYLDCDVEKLGVDLLTISSHKIYGPKGIGALYIKEGTPVKPLAYGGGQEAGIKPGTENTPYIVGFGKAVEIIKEDKETEILRDYLIEELLKIEEVKLNGSKENRLPNNVNVSIPGLEGEALITLLGDHICFSTGSACSSKSLESSHVLTAIGLDDEYAHSSIRLSLGRDTTKKEIDIFIKELIPGIIKLRQTSGYVS